MRSEDRAQYICQIWYEQGVNSGVYLSGFPYQDLTPEHRANLMLEAIHFASITRLLPTRRQDGKRKRWVWLDKQ